MPKVTIWIREEDYEAWQGVKDKPALIHKVLETVKQKQQKELVESEPVIVQEPYA